MLLRSPLQGLLLRSHPSTLACRLTLLLNKAMLAPIEGMKQAHGQLTAEERVGWAMGLHAGGGLCVGDLEDELRFYLGGRLTHGDQMSGG